MIEVLQAKARRLFENGFSGYAHLPFPKQALIYREDTLAADSERVVREFCGFITSKMGERFFVFVERGPSAPHLLLVVVVDALTGDYAGHVTLVLLPPTQELTCWSFYLEGVKGKGIGRALVERFAQYLPEGVNVTFRIEEKNTRGFLLCVVDDLIEAGEISNWRVDSPERPRVEQGCVRAMPMADQEKIQRVFLREHLRLGWPVLRMMAYMNARFVKLRAGLSDQGRFVFEAYAQITRRDDLIAAA